MDINLHSFNGPQDSEKVIDWSDKTIIPSAEISDTIKCSTGLRKTKIILGEVHGGNEDAIDVNKLCEDIEISAKLWSFTNGRSKYGFTLKGGSKNISLSGIVAGDPLVDIGNASDQSHDLTTGVVLNLKRLDGKPIRVRVLGGDLPVLVDGSGPYRFIFPWKSKILRTITTKVFLQLRRTFSR